MIEPDDIQSILTLLHSFGSALQIISTLKPHLSYLHIKVYKSYLFEYNQLCGLAMSADRPSVAIILNQTEYICMTSTTIV